MQWQRKVEVAQQEVASAMSQRDHLAAQLQAKEEELMQMEGQLSMLQQDVRDSQEGLQ